MEPGAANCILRKWMQQYLPFHKLLYNVTLTFHPSRGSICAPFSLLGGAVGEGEQGKAIQLLPWNTCTWSPELLFKKIILRQPCCVKAQAIYKTSSPGLLPRPSTRHVSERALRSSQAPAVESSPAFRSPQLRPQTSWSRFTLSPLGALWGFLTHGIHNLHKTFYSTKFGAVCSAAVVTKTSSNGNSQT